MKTTVGERCLVGFVFLQALRRTRLKHMPATRGGWGRRQGGREGDQHHLLHPALQGQLGLLGLSHSGFMPPGPCSVSSLVTLASSRSVLCGLPLSLWVRLPWSHFLLQPLCSAVSPVLLPRASYPCDVPPYLPPSLPRSQSHAVLGPPSFSWQLVCL